MQSSKYMGMKQVGDKLLRNNFETNTFEE